ncbi:MAG: hypothetical protein BYD32DRAFT_441376 [Podila humilis]|nr:MAG: hypothetical protein BYD32DRAFT_441376 [Podila humilis]
MRLSLVEHHSSLQLLFAFSLTAILSSTFALPYPTPSPSIQHQHRRAQPPTRNDLLGQSVSSALTEAWIDYYTLDGAFLAEDVANSGACVTIPNTWGILLVTPTTYSDSTLVLYNDASCSTVNREPGGQTGLIVIAIYFTQRPGSLRWTSSLAVTSSPSSMSAIAPTSTTFSGAPTTISVELPPPTSLTSNPSAISAPNKPPGNGPVPTPIHSTFPKALIPPKPLDPSASSGNDPCTHNENDACQKARHVTQFLIVGIAVAVLTVGLMMGGSYYIYKKFYTPEEPPMSSSSFASKSRAPPLPPLATVKNQRRRRGSLDEDFDDEDDEEEGGGGGETFHPNEHGLRFNHRGDNIGGSKSTGSYQYDHSDISLVERVKQ